MGSDGLQLIWKNPNNALQDHHVQETTKHGGGKKGTTSVFQFPVPNDPI